MLEQPTPGQNFNLNHFMSESFFPFLQKNRKWLFLLLVVALIVGLVYLIGGLLHDPEGMIDDFETAIREGNVDELESMITVEHEEVKVDKNQLKNFVDYARKDPNYLRELINIMKAQYYYAEGEPWNVPTNIPKDYLAAGDYYIKHTEIPLFYDSYEIVMRPYYIKIETNEPGAIIKLNGKEVFRTTENNKEYAITTAMPGKYSFLIEKNFEFAKLSSKEEVVAFGEEERVIEKKVELTGETIRLSSEFPDTKIVVNGKDINKSSDRYSEFGPVSLNGTIKIQGKRSFPWGEETSLEHVLEQDTVEVNITPIAFTSKKSKQNATKIINDFFKSEMVALVNQDVNKLVNVSDNLRKKYTEDITNLKESKSWWKGKTVGTRIDFSQAEIRFDEYDNLYEVNIPVEVHYNYRKYSELSNEGPLKDEFKEYIVRLVYDYNKKTFLIDRLGSDYSSYRDSYMKHPLVVKTEFK